MTGAIYLGGGGDATDEKYLWRAMLPPKRRVLYWPFALPAEMVLHAQEWLTTSLLELELDVELETWVDLRGHHPDEITHADLLFVGGGNTFKLLQHVRGSGFAEAIRVSSLAAATTMAEARGRSSRVPTSRSQSARTRTRLG